MLQGGTAETPQDEMPTRSPSPAPPVITTPALLRAWAGLPSRRDAKLLLPDAVHTQLAEADGSDRSYHSLSLIS